MELLKKLEEEQIEIARNIVLEDRFEKIKTICGVDISYKKELARIAAVVMDFKTMKILEKNITEMIVKFPYIPTFLAYRELPSYFDILEKIKIKADIVMVNGHGIAHPRMCGIATHLGYALEIPTIGIAQNLLVGKFNEPKNLFEAKPIFFKGKQVGWVLKTKKKCKPIFISPGNMVNINSSLEITKMCIRGYKLPEPIRIADKLSKFIQK